MSNVTRVSPLVTAHINLAANPSSLGSTQLVAAVTGVRYRVLSVVVVTTAANSVKFQSNASDISATFPLGANGGLVLPFNEHGWFSTSLSEALSISLSANTSTAVQIQYIAMAS